MEKPLIVTLKLDEPAKTFFNELRKKYYPAHFNFVEAHLTLFHSLPANEKLIHETLALYSKRSKIELTICNLENTKNGISYLISSPALQNLHAQIQDLLKEYLHEKDKQTLNPHITIQHKVTEFKASQVFEKLSADFKSFVCYGSGLSTFMYNKGPWIHFADYDFTE